MDDFIVFVVYTFAGALISMISFRRGFLQGQRDEREDRQWRRWS